MSEIRIDQLNGLRAILAPGRAERPDAFAPEPAQTSPGAAESCPFCLGREDRTPPEVWANRPQGGGSDTPGWLARSVPNLYPVLDSPESGVQVAGAVAAMFLKADSQARSIRSPLRLAAPRPISFAHSRRPVRTR